MGEFSLRAWVVEDLREGENLKAVKICSALLQDHLWVVTDRSFETERIGRLLLRGTPGAHQQDNGAATGDPQCQINVPRCRVIQEGLREAF